MQRPGLTTAVICAGMVVLLAITFPFLGRAYFPRTDPGQFIIDVHMPSGSRLEVSNDYIAKVEQMIRSVVKPKDLDMIVSNIGVYPDLSAIYTTNASMDTAFVQTSLKEDHSIGSYEYMRRVQAKLSREMPELSTYFQAGGLVDGVINQGLPAPIDIQIRSQDMDKSYDAGPATCRQDPDDSQRKQRLHPTEHRLSRPRFEHRSRKSQPDRALRQRRRRQRDHRHHVRWHGRAQLLDRSQDRQQLHGHRAVREQVDRQHVNAGLPQYPAARNRACRLYPNGGGQDGRPDSPAMFQGDHTSGYVPLGEVADIQHINTPTEVDHMQIRRVIDIYVATKTEALQSVGASINRISRANSARPQYRHRCARCRGQHE